MDNHNNQGKRSFNEKKPKKAEKSKNSQNDDERVFGNGLLFSLGVAGLSLMSRLIARNAPQIITELLKAIGITDDSDKSSDSEE